MGLLDSLKGNKKEKEPRFCYRCGKDCSGFLNALPLEDGKYVCHDCYPTYTKLMNKKGVLSDDYKGAVMSSREVDRLIQYREADKVRQAEFHCDETFLSKQILVDREHMWFKLKDYEEIFELRAIEHVVLAVTKPTDGKFAIDGGLFLKNKYYKMLPISGIFKSHALMKKNQMKELADYLAELHSGLCPNAEFDVVS